MKDVCKVIFLLILLLFAGCTSEEPELEPELELVPIIIDEEAMMIQPTIEEETTVIQPTIEAWLNQSSTEYSLKGGYPFPTIVTKLDNPYQLYYSFSIDGDYQLAPAVKEYTSFFRTSQFRVYRYGNFEPPMGQTVYFQVRDMSDSGEIQAASDILTYQVKEQFETIGPKQMQVFQYDPQTEITFSWSSPSNTIYNGISLTIYKKDSSHGDYPVGIPIPSDQTSYTLVLTDPLFTQGTFYWYITALEFDTSKEPVTDIVAAGSQRNIFILE